jgi:hypothetical protein
MRRHAIACRAGELGGMLNLARCDEEALDCFVV